MRNLKRALSLTLASVMLLGMMVVGAGAAGYKDVTDDHNVEAIEVLQAVGAMIGDEAGNFDPDANVNRAQIATIMSRLLDLKVEDFNAADIPFTDVPEWAVPFVAACYADGITSGISATAFGSSNNVTAAQAALMMMKALGYFQYQDDFGDDWQLATIKQASEIGLFYGVTVDRTSPLTRNDVAQMALNALKSNMVAFTGEVGFTYPVNGDKPIHVGYKPEYTIKTSADPIYDRIDNLATTIDKPTGQYEMQLGEYLYGGDLRLTSTTDVFGRPARYWEFDGEEIGTYVKEELLRQAYTTSVTGKTLYDLLGSATLKDYELNVTIDGVSDPKVFDGFVNDKYNEYWPLFNATYLNRNNDSTVGATGNGVLTQVFVDTSDKTVYIAIINTYLAQANDDYDEKNELVDLDVYGITKVSTKVSQDIYAKAKSQEEITVTAEEFNISDVASGDFFLVTVADGAIQSMKTPDVLSAVEISSFSKGNSLTTDGTKYDYADTLYHDQDALGRWTDGDKINLKELTYNVYLDQYGYAIGVEEVDTPNNYLFITGVNGNYNNLVNVNVEANAIFLDGTMETITINGRKSKFYSAHEELKLDVDEGATVNRWFTYTKSSSGVYTVQLVDYGVDKALGQFHEDRDGTNTPGNDMIDYKKHNVMVYGTKDLYTTDVADHVVYSNDKTVFLTASVDELQTSAGNFSVVIDDVDSVAVGIDNVDITPWGHSYVTSVSDFAESNKDHAPMACGDGKTAGDNCNLSYGVYALYNSKGYILGMVVVGEDNGMADNLVYVDSGSVKDESYDKATEKWTWTRNAIVNGERVLLTEVNDSGISLLEKMVQHHWYRVNYNANGEVTKVRAHHYDPSTGCPTDSFYCFDKDEKGLPDWAFGTTYRYVHAYDETPNAIYDAITASGVSVVLYHQQFFQDKPVNDGHTLYMTRAADQASGIRYTEDTGVVFIQMERNKWSTEFWKGESGVKKALKALDPVDKDGNYNNYAISALWKDGRATTIIIRDLNNQGQDGEWNVVKSGPVVFSNKSVIDKVAGLQIMNAWARPNDRGVGHVYFELDSYEETGKIDNGGAVDPTKIPFTYHVYVNGTEPSDRVLVDQDGTLTKKAGASNVWQFDKDVGEFYNADDKIYVEITSITIVSTPKPVEVEMEESLKDAGLTADFGGMDPGDTIPSAKPGDKITVRIGKAENLARAAAEEGITIEAGKTYWVEFNSDKASAIKAVANDKAVLTVEVTLTEEIIERGELKITAIYDQDPNPGTPEPGVKVESVELNKETLSLEKGKTETLIATVKPANAENQDVTWESDNIKVATVDKNGKITAVDVGTAKITVTTVDGGKTATCTVTVTETPAGDNTKAPGSVAVDDKTKPDTPELTYYYAALDSKGDAVTADTFDTDAMIKALNSKLTGKTITYADTLDLSAGTVTVYETVDGKYVKIEEGYTFKIAGVYSVSLNGKLVAWEEDSEGVVVPTTYAKDTKLMTDIYSKSEPTTVVDRNGKVTVTIAKKNVDLQPGYQVKLGDGLTGTACMYSDKPITKDNEGTALDDGGYIVDGLYLSLKGTAKDGTLAALSINGTMQGTEKVTGDFEEIYPVTFNAKTMTEDGVVTLNEMSGYKLKIGSKTVPGLFEADDKQVIPAGYEGTYYVFAGKDGVTYPWADEPITIAKATVGDDGKLASEVDLSSTAANDDGVIVLYAKSDFVEVTFTTGAKYSVLYTVDGEWVGDDKPQEMNASDNDVTLLVKSGTQLIVTIEGGTVTMAIGEGEARDLKGEEEIPISNTAGYTFAKKDDGT